MKKKNLKTLIAFMVMLMPLVAPALNTITYTAYYNGDAITGTDTLGGVTYTTVHYDGLYNGGAPGTPSLPVDYIRFSVPYNATNFTVTSTQSNTFIIHLNNMVYPCQQPRLMNDTTPVVITLPDSSAYFSGSYFPSPRAWVVDEGFLEGENHIVTVAVMPITYKHASSGAFRDVIKKSESVQITLRYDLSNQLAMYPIIRQDTTWRNEGYALTRSIVANPSNVVANAPVEMSMDSLIFINPTPGDGLNGDIHPPTPIDTTGMGTGTGPSIVNGGDLVHIEDYYPYLIVTTPDLEHAVRRIAALKKQKGYNVKVVTMNEVVNDSIAKQGDRIKQTDGTYAIADTNATGKLRQFLKYYFKYHGTKFVLLAGKEIPNKNIPNPNNTENFNLLSDLYYSDLSANWDYNSWNPDYFPELYVGRLILRDSSQMDNYTDKLFRYELNPGDGEHSFLNRAFFSEGREFRGMLSEIKGNMMSFYPLQIEINDTATNNTKYPKGKDIIDALNACHVGFASILNHGSSTGIRVYGKDDNMVSYDINAISDMNHFNGLNYLTNKKDPMIYYAISCSSLPFDNNDVNLGESFTTGKDYGGPVFVGYTRNISTYGTIPIFERFVINLKEGMYKLGMADAFSKALPSRFGTYCEIITHAYIGDPSLELWTNEPQQFSDINITRTNNTISVTGIDVDSITVAYSPNNGASLQTVVSSLGVTFNNVDPNSMIMLYKHNYLPHIVPLYLQNVSLNKSKYIIASDVIAGNSVDNNRTPGDVIVETNVEYEIEASGTVTLDDGFKVEKGATFAVYPSSF